MFIGLDTVRLRLSKANLARVPDYEKWEVRNGHMRGLYDQHLKCVVARALEAPLSTIERARLSTFRLYYFPPFNCFELELGLPTFLRGNNLVLANETDVAAAVSLGDALVRWALSDEDNVIHEDFMKDGEFAIPSVAHWDVSRFDTAFDFLPLKSPNDVARTAVLSLRPSDARISAQLYEPATLGPASLYVKNVGWARKHRLQITAYDKAEQHEQKTATKVQPRIRVEVSVRGSREAAFAVHGRKLGRERLATLNDLSAQALTTVFFSKLGRLGLHHDVSRVIGSEAELIAVVGKTVAKNAWPYMSARALGETAQAAAAAGITLESGQRIERNMRARGIYPAAGALVGPLQEMIDQIGGVGALALAAE